MIKKLLIFILSLALLVAQSPQNNYQVYPASSGSGGITALTGGVTASGTGSVVATVVQIPPGVTLTGTPSTGQVPTATSSSAATWQTPGSTGFNPLDQTSVTITQPICSNPYVNSGFGQWWTAYSGNQVGCQSAASADQPTYMQQNTGATTNNTAHWTINTAQPFGPIMTPATFRPSTFVYVGGITPITSVFYGIGWSDSVYPSQQPAGGNGNMIGLKFDTSIPDTDFRCVIYSSHSSVANVDTGVAAFTGFHTFKITVASGSVTCSVDGTAVTATGTLPTIGQSYPGAWVQTLTTASVTINSGFTALQVSGLNR